MNKGRRVKAAARRRRETFQGSWAPRIERSVCVGYQIPAGPVRCCVKRPGQKSPGLCLSSQKLLTQECEAVRSPIGRLTSWGEEEQPDRVPAGNSRLRGRVCSSSRGHTGRGAGRRSLPHPPQHPPEGQGSAAALNRCLRVDKLSDPPSRRRGHTSTLRQKRREIGTNHGLCPRAAHSAPLTLLCDANL